MFFKNATLFRMPPSLLQGIVAPSNEQCDERVQPTLEQALAECSLKPIGALELSTYGFVKPFGSDFDGMTQTVGNHVLVTLAGEHKILPPSSINALLAKKVAEFEQKEGRRPSGKARKRMKEDIVNEILPKALTKPSRTNAIINTEHGYIAVDTTSRKVAEQVISAIRIAVGSFPAIPLNSEVAPRSVLTSWVSGEEMLPLGLSMGDEIELRDPADDGAVVKCKGQELESDEIAKHLESGKQVTRLSLCLDDHVSFSFDEGLTLRKLRFLDGAMESLADVDSDDMQGELNARLALMGAELECVFLKLEPAFSLSKAEV